MIVISAWESRGRVRSLVFFARSNSTVRTGRDGRGMGQVDVEQVSDATLIFRERGAWLSESGILAPLRGGWQQSGLSEEEITALFEETRDEARLGRRGPQGMPMAQAVIEERDR